MRRIGSTIAASIKEMLTPRPRAKKPNRRLPNLPHGVISTILKHASPGTQASAAETSTDMKKLTKYLIVESALKKEQETIGTAIKKALIAVDKYRNNMKTHKNNQPYWNTLKNIEKESKLPPPFSKYLKQAIQEFMKEYPDWRKQYTVAFDNLKDGKIYNVVHKYYMKFRSKGGLGELGKGLTVDEQKKLLKKYTMNFAYNKK